MFTRFFLLVPLCLLFVGQSAEAQRVRLETKMGVKDGASATAKYRSRGDKRRKLNVELEDAAPNTMFSVEITRAGKPVYSNRLQTNGLGMGAIDIDVNEGDTVPLIEAGDTVTISANGAKMWGILRKR